MKGADDDCTSELQQACGLRQAFDEDAVRGYEPRDPLPRLRGDRGCNGTLRRSHARALSVVRRSAMQRRDRYQTGFVVSETVAAFALCALTSWIVIGAASVGLFMWLVLSGYEEL